MCCPNLRSGAKDWFFLGTPGYGAPFHIDEVRHPSWQAQIRGVKTWYDVIVLYREAKNL